MNLRGMNFKPAGQLSNGLFPWRAAKATLALNAGLCFSFCSVSFSCSSIPIISGAGLSLIHLSDLLGPPQWSLYSKSALPD